MNRLSRRPAWDMSLLFRFSMFASAALTTGLFVVAVAAPGFDRLQFTAVSGVGGATYVCLVESASGHGRWLTIGVERGGLLAEQYDAEQNAVLIRSGEHTRWLKMRRSEIRSIPVARNEDGTVDWIHMNMTNREKEDEARAMHWDILNISYLGRSGQLHTSSPARDADTSRRR